MIVGIIAKEFIKYIEHRKGVNFVEKYNLKSFPIFCARHDIGKASPGFQEMLNLNAEASPNYSSLSEIEVDYCIRHEQVSAEFLKHSDCYLEDNGQFALAIIRWHHGGFREAKHSWDDDYIPDSFGNDDGNVKWNSIRQLIDNELVNFFGNGYDFVDSFKKHATGGEQLAINNPHVKYLCGLLSTCDWIGSDEDNFDHSTYYINEEIDTDLIANRAREIIEAIGLDFSNCENSLGFGNIFKDSKGVEYIPNWIQSSLADAIDRKGVYVIEANMGEGKTEAALYAAYSAMNKGIVNGIYFGLPTQVTSNSIFDRYSKFLTNCGFPDNARLIHGKASFSEKMSSRCSWFSGNKKGILAQFGVGTIDQALISVMGGIKHFYIRTFGLSNKCVIIDEVHSYDVYTSELITELIDQLLELECVVIILSATLTATLRARLCGLNAVESIDAYPLITKVTESEVAYKRARTKANNKKVHVRRVQVGAGGGFGRLDTFFTGRQQLIDEARERASRGEAVLWIENTVGEAQRVFSQFGNSSFDVGLLHSNYTHRDRTINENNWITRLGVNGDRSKGCVLVSTQVCEQSVDLDADFLVTALCPTDMLFQRMGRLHRHPKNVRKSPPECVIMDRVEYGEMEYSNIQTTIQQEYCNRCGVSTLVYSPITLRKTHEVFNQVHTLELPSDIRHLLEKTYDVTGNVDPISLALISANNNMKNRMKNEAARAKARSTGSSSDNIDGFSDDAKEIDQTMRATRMITNTTVDVVICSSIDRKSLKKFTPLYGSQIDISKKMKNSEYQLVNEAQLKINEDLIKKFTNVFVTLEAHKNRFVAFELREGMAVDLTTGRTVTAITYDERGFKYTR